MALLIDSTMYDPSIEELRGAIADVWGCVPTLGTVRRLMHAIVDGGGSGSWVFRSTVSPCRVSWGGRDGRGRTPVRVSPAKV